MIFQSAIPDDAKHIVVHLRNADDIQALVAENQRLEADLKKAQRDIFTWVGIGQKYHDCLDELKELRLLLRKHGITHRFRNI